MKLSRAECIYLIEKAGMEVKEEEVSLNAYRDRIFYNGERVGTVYYDSVSLSPHYLSINDLSVTVQYKAEDAVKRLEIEIYRIVNYDFESEKRKLRADTVRKYFKDRKDAETVLSQPTYDYNQLLKQLVTQRKEEKL